MEIDEGYQQYYPLIKSISYTKSRQTRIPREEFESGLCEALWEALRTFDDTKSCGIDTWVTRLLKQAATRVIKSKDGTHYQRVYTTLDEPNKDDEDTPISKLSDGESTENAFFRRRYKKEADQRQLIDFLANDPSQVDRETRLIVSQFSQYESITALAKALGMHHEFVKRKLRKLSTRYDANRFGDYRDYLAV